MRPRLYLSDESMVRLNTENSIFAVVQPQSPHSSIDLSARHSIEPT